jgi:hypothetical protein
MPKDICCPIANSAVQRRLGLLVVYFALAGTLCRQMDRLASTKVNGVELHYLQRGSGPPVVFPNQNAPPVDNFSARILT